jgi:hypothetical protein
MDVFFGNNCLLYNNIINTVQVQIVIITLYITHAMKRYMRFEIDISGRKKDIENAKEFARTRVSIC